MKTGFSLRHLVCLFVLAAGTAAAGEPYEAITQEQINSIEYDDAMEDRGFVAPLAADLTHMEGDMKKEFDEWVAKLDDWQPGKVDEIGQRVRNWLCLATLGDVARGMYEAESPYVIFERLKKDIPKDKLIKATAWVILKPGEGKAITTAPDAGIDGEAAEETVRERTVLYAKKLLGRLLGKLPPKE